MFRRKQSPQEEWLSRKETICKSLDVYISHWSPTFCCNNNVDDIEKSRKLKEELVNARKILSEISYSIDSRVSGYLSSIETAKREMGLAMYSNISLSLEHAISQIVDAVKELAEL